MNIKYPDQFDEILCEQIDYYLGHKTNRCQKKIMKRLIEDLSMQTEVYPILLKLKNTNIPETTPPTNTHPISLYLHYCIKIYESCKQIDPLNQKDYKACFDQISKSASCIIKNIRILKKAGAYHAESIRNSLLNSLDLLALSAKAASRHKPIYSHGNMGMTRRTKDYQYHYFITRLGLYTEDLYKKPLYKIIAITANVIFDKDNLFNEDNVKKKLFEFKKNSGIKK